jgi:hypothetical protein
MINRRYLRIKVYQSLYAFFQSDGGSAAKIEKELFLSVERTFDLAVALLLLFGEMKREAEDRITERKQKRLPTAEDLNPSVRFIANPVLTTLADSELLQRERKAADQLDGGGRPDRKLFRQFARRAPNTNATSKPLRSASSSTRPSFCTCSWSTSPTMSRCTIISRRAASTGWRISTWRVRS